MQRSNAPMCALCVYNVPPWLFGKRIVWRHNPCHSRGFCPNVVDAEFACLVGVGGWGLGVWGLESVVA
jgi:hypothetical protein